MGARHLCSNLETCSSTRASCSIRAPRTVHKLAADPKDGGAGILFQLGNPVHLHARELFIRAPRTVHKLAGGSEGWGAASCSKLGKPVHLRARALHPRAPELFISFLERCATQRQSCGLVCFRVSGWNSFWRSLSVQAENLSMGAIAGGSIPQPKCAKENHRTAL